MKTMSYVDIDVIPFDDMTVMQMIKWLRVQINPKKNPNGLHAKLITAEDCNGNMNVRLTCYSEEKLQNWLDSNEYSDCKI